MSDKSRICEIGEKKLIDGKWYEKTPVRSKFDRCAGCAFLVPGGSCTKPDAPIEQGGQECAMNLVHERGLPNWRFSIWVACESPQPEAQPVEECAGCRYWKGYGDIGDCHRSTPACLESVTFGLWPTTKRSDWCGEWKERG